MNSQVKDHLSKESDLIFCQVKFIHDLPEYFSAGKKTPQLSGVFSIVVAKSPDLYMLYL